MSVKKLHVECNWCFWNGERKKSRLSVRCPKCRKSHTVELFDPKKKYSDEEFERHRKMKMVEIYGAKEIRPNVWISTNQKIYSDREMTKRKEFDDYYVLYQILTKESIFIWTNQAWAAGKKYAQIFGVFIKIKNPRKIRCAKLKASRSAKQSTKSRKFLRLVRGA